MERRNPFSRGGLLPRILTIVVLSAVVFATFAYTGVSPEARSFLDGTFGSLLGRTASGPDAAGDRIASPTPDGSASGILCETSPDPTEDVDETKAEPTAGPEPTGTAEPTDKAEPDPTAKPEPTDKPAVERKAPVVEAFVVEGGLKLSWTAAQGEGLRGYKVVASSEDGTPSYPENGYFRWITDLTVRKVWIESGASYNGGDFCRFEAGRSYWFGITAVYEDGTATSNVLKLTVPVAPTSKPLPDLATPQVEVAVVGSEVVVEWNRIEDERLVGFKVVASFANEHPAYPDDGYLFWISDPTCVRATACVDDGYNGGDFEGSFVPGTAYWFSVTAIYEVDGEWVKVAGNAVSVVFLESAAE